jgi:hypothetical protein
MIVAKAQTKPIKVVGGAHGHGSAARVSLSTERLPELNAHAPTASPTAARDTRCGSTNTSREIA